MKSPIEFAIRNIRRRFIGGYRTRMVRTGKLYPHSNVKQQQRYARQVAKGQLRMKGIPQ